MSTPFEPINTADIAWVEGLPYANRYEDIYFSAENGLHEAMHVFIEGNQLIERWKRLTPEDHERFVIGETGFGTGLNFLLAWSVWDRVAPKSTRLHFISCEKHPLTSKDLKQSLALWPELAKYAQALLASYPLLTPGYHRLEWDEGRVTLDLMLGDALTCYQERLLCGDERLEADLRRDWVDAWFLDGFSPSKNPDMWSEALFATLFQLSKIGTTLSTFSAAGMVKSGLKQAGFEVNKRPGHGQKRDMLIAVKQVIDPKPESFVRTIKRKTPWHVPLPKRIKNKQAIVIGAGLAGCCMAYALARRGWQVRVLDNQSAAGLGASGNQRAILFPNLSAYRAPLTALMLSGFLYASRFYQTCIQQWPIGNFSGILQLIREKKSDHSQADLAKWLSAYPELGRFVDPEQASELTGVAVHSAGLFIPMAGWIDSPALCMHVLQMPGIQFFPNTVVQSLDVDPAGEWHVEGHSAEVVIVANGYQANQLALTKYLAIKPIRGQMTGVHTSSTSRGLNIPLCGEGHILPMKDNQHAIGATFGLGSSDHRCLPHEDEINFAKINSLPAHLGLSKTILSHWSGVRGAAQDHLPLVGPVAKAALFTENYRSLKSNPNRWIPSAGQYYPGLYIAAGFGARGLTTIPLCTDYLAGFINHEPSHLPQDLVQAISPARFLLRGLFRS